MRTTASSRGLGMGAAMNGKSRDRRGMAGRKLFRRVFLALGLAAALAQSGAGLRTVQAATQNADQFLIVDCLLPGKIKQLGTQVTYVGARQAVRTTASDCGIRGGEYTSYDRADYGTALQVWLAPAQAGDPKAQTYVGEIYEKQNDFASAAQWYQKAASQGYAPAQIDLGSLYEQGKGVPKDPQQALAWYRKASGVQDLALQTAAPAVVPQTTKPESNAETEKLKK